MLRGEKSIDRQEGEYKVWGSLPALKALSQEALTGNVMANIFNFQGYALGLRSHGREACPMAFTSTISWVLGIPALYPVYPISSFSESQKLNWKLQHSTLFSLPNLLMKWTEFTTHFLHLDLLMPFRRAYLPLCLPVSASPCQLYHPSLPSSTPNICIAYHTTCTMFHCLNY